MMIVLFLRLCPIPLLLSLSLFDPSPRTAILNIVVNEIEEIYKMVAPQLNM